MRILILTLAAVLVGACGKKTESPKKDAPVPVADGLGLVDESHGTSQRQLVNETIQRARASGKVVLVRATGAWCPPCVAWDIYLEEHVGELKETLEKYEKIALDEVFYERGTATDHLPIDTIWYPSYYAFNPSSGQWAFIPIHANNLTALASFKAALAAFAAGEDLTARYQKLAKDFIQNQVRFSANTESGSVAMYTLYAAGINTALNRSKDETYAFLDELKSSITANPKLVEESTFSYSFVLVHSMRAAVSRGIVSGPDGWTKVSEDLNSSGSAKADQYQEGLYMFFRSPLSNLRRNSGIKAVAEACPGHIDAMKGVKGMNSERARVLALECMQFATEAGLKTKEEALALADLAEADLAFMAAEKPFKVLSRLRLSAKDLNGAAKLVDTIKDTAFKAREESYASRHDVFAKDDEAIAKERAGKANPVKIDELEGAKAANIIRFNNIPKLRDYEFASYSELVALLRSGFERPALKRVKTGAGDL